MKFLKRTGFFLGYGLAFIATLALLWRLAAGLYGDDRLDASLRAFYHIDYTGYDKNNGAIAMRGLEAPASEKDSYRWALKVTAAHLEKLRDAPKEKPTPAQIGHLWSAHPLREDRADSTPYVFYKGDNSILRICPPERYYWHTYPYMRQRSDPATCARKPEAIQKLAADNALLLSRYKRALQQTHYFETGTGMPYGQTLLRVQELYIAQLAGQSAQDRRKALRDWLENMEFYNRAVTGRVDAAQLTVLMVCRGLAQKILPDILQNDTALARQYREKLLSALRPIGPGDVQIGYDAKLFYSEAAMYIEALDRYDQNKIYHFHQAYADAWQNPSAARWDALQQSTQVNGWLLHWADWRFPADSILANLILNGLSVGHDLEKTMLIAQTRSNMLAAYVRMIAQTTAPAEVARFLALPAVPQDSVRGRPFRYNEKDHILYFIYTTADDIDHMEGIYVFRP